MSGQKGILRGLVPWMIGAAVIGLVAFLILHKGSGYTVRAELQDTGGLMVHSTVKVGDVPAGTVTSLQVTPRTTVIATLKLNKNAAPIGAGATVQIRPSDLLGEHYASLSTGDLRHPQPSGSFIPLSRTSEPVELDDILNMLQPDTRTAIGLLINEAGIGLLGRNADLGQLLRVMPQSLSQTQALVSQIGSQNQALENMISKGASITQVVDGKGDQLGQLIDQAGRSLQVVAQKHVQLGNTIAAAPPAFSQLISTLNTLTSASSDITPAADQLRATTPALTQTLNLLSPFASSAKGALTQARSVAPSLTQLGQQGTSPLGVLGNTGATISDFSTNSKQALDMVDQRGMRDLLWFVQSWAGALQNRDNIGHLFHVILEVSDTQLLVALQSYLNNPNAPFKVSLKKHKAAAAPVAVAPPAAAPITTKLPQIKTPKLPNTVSNIVSGATQVVQTVVSNAQQAVSNTGQVVSDTLGQANQAVNNVVGGLTGHSPSSAQSSSSSNGNDATRLFDYLFGS
jgi:virulence factor Mce-like protein